MSAAKRFGYNLALARAEAGMTQRELSARVSLSRITLSRYEHGKANPHLDQLVKLAEACGVQVRDLLYGVG
ncbi:MAG TPA: helix-turn-helix transcriptional regulator [Polyangiaceae bacterium]|nr:helix-turn-helix transcriptional regulator [Polyangiaceae bacterium]